MRKPYHFVGSGLPNVYLVGVEYEVDRETGEQRASIPRLPDLLTWVAVSLLSKEAPRTGDELRFLRKRVGKSSKDFAQLLGVTSEQYSRIENGATVTPANDKLARLLVMTLSVVEALKQPELMQRAAKHTWSSVVGPDQQIIVRVRGVWPRACGISPSFPRKMRRSAGLFGCFHMVRPEFLIIGASRIRR